MGLYIRKSVRVGPFRFNLSGSGVGVSVGLPGFRIGSGPRGNYVQMGAHGIYYRAALNPEPHAQRHQQPSVPNVHQRAQLLDLDRTHAPLEEIESGDVAHMVNSSSKALLDEISDKQRAIRLAPIAFIAVISAVAGSVWTHWPNWASIVIAIIGVGLIIAAAVRDTLRKSVVVFYALDATAERAFQGLHDAAEQMSHCSGVWHIEAAGAVRDRRYHAGASSLLRRKSTFINNQPPKRLKTNIATVAIGVGWQTLHFFPDRVLVYDASGVGAVDYRDLRLNVHPTRFIEDAGAPGDATVVGQTWRFVNKNGSPDRRFNNNRQLPICLYDEMTLTSASGLNELMQLSKSGVANGFASAIATLARALPMERWPAVVEQTARAPKLA